LKRILVFILFVAVAYGIYTFGFNQTKKIISEPFVLYDGFNQIDRETWYVGEWETHQAAYSKVFVENGIVRLPVNETDRGPYLLSLPILRTGYDLLSIKRRVLVAPANGYFAGGFAVFETDDDRFRPTAQDQLPFGNAGLLIEYAQDPLEMTTRPGEEAIRLLAPNWRDNNVVTIEPIFGEWFTEEITYDLKNGAVTYKLNDKSYTLKSIPLTKSYIRLWMHSFGHFTGHQISIDYIEVRLTQQGVHADE